MRIGFAQINTTVGDIRANRDCILSAYEKAVSLGADLVLTPELALTGYPPQDLVFKSRFVPETLESLEQLGEAVGSVPLLVGYVDFNPGKTGKPFVNACGVLAKKEPVRKIFKTLLPTYDVFDEARYFDPAPDQKPIELLGTKIGITICEDIWTDKYLDRNFYHQDPVSVLIAKGESAYDLVGRDRRRGAAFGVSRRDHRERSRLVRRHGGFRRSDCGRDRRQRRRTLDGDCDGVEKQDGPERGDRDRIQSPDRALCRTGVGFSFLLLRAANES